MTLRQYLIIMTFATILCWASWGFVILNINPYEAGTVGMTFFFVSLFCSLLGTNSIFIFFLYRILWGKTLRMFRYVERSFRDSLILSTVLIVLLYLQGKQLLNSWILGSFLLLIIFSVAFLFSIQKAPKN